MDDKFLMILKVGAVGMIGTTIGSLIATAMAYHNYFRKRNQMMAEHLEITDQLFKEAVKEAAVQVLNEYKNEGQED